eukprot:TRINITY_DN7817_c0_g1_i12.p1 TRINITY_DN7817_c0_g1~~TRINITY_DN7817_c0_g1_i12.p1  ORF type:complete len:464 (-),score=123.82 TRINITY_DN7817_c0_g1_i12:23-1414(-)
MFELLFSLLIASCVLVPELSCEVSNGKSYGVNLKVYQSDNTGLVSKKNIKLVEGHVLNLTCTVEGAYDTKEVKLSWYAPSALAKSQKRLKDKEFEENGNLVIFPISEGDSGIYFCEAISSKGEHLQKESVRVLVEPDWGNCQPGFYNCNGTSPSKPYCIPKRYRCDGKEDCPLGDDESELPCGFDPCKGKISCPELDFRCIDPSEHCCNPDEDENCRVQPCCQAVLDYNNRSKDRPAPKSKKELTNAGYDQIFYTAVGCCTVFILVVGLVFGLIKYQLFKTRRHEGGRQRPPLTLHDLDLMYGGGAWGAGNGGGGAGAHGGVDPADRNLSITLNINHGVQIMRPPPYSNRHDGPPPPYRLEGGDPNGGDGEAGNPLLQESNNNGDINGNSNPIDNNNPNRNMEQHGNNNNPPPPAAAENGQQPAAGNSQQAAENGGQQQAAESADINDLRPPPYPGHERNTPL